jgi:hypothetical protein
MLLDLDTRIRNLPLKQMESSLLARAIYLEARDVNHTSGTFRQVFDYETLRTAMSLAGYLHRNQTRANRGDLPRTHYIEHPLRNALRLLRYGVTYEGLVVAAILHDTVEDCLDELLEVLGLSNVPMTDSTEDKRNLAWYGLGQMFDHHAASLVLDMTNPILPSGLSKTEKRTLYVEHVTKAIEDPYVALGKLVDFIDNGAGLHHNNVPGNHEMISHLAQKYLPLVPIFQKRVAGDDIRQLVSREGYGRVVSQLRKASETLGALAILR